MNPFNTIATKQDVLDLEERLIEHMRGMQTELLRGFASLSGRVDIDTLRVVDTGTLAVKSKTRPDIGNPPGETA